MVPPWCCLLAVVRAQELGGLLVPRVGDVGVLGPRAAMEGDLVPIAGEPSLSWGWR